MQQILAKIDTTLNNRFNEFETKVHKEINGFVKFEIKILNQQNIMIKPIKRIKGNIRPDN